MHVPNGNTISRVHHPIGLRHIKIDVLVERDGVRKARWKTKLRDHRDGHRNWRRQIPVYMLNGPKEEELVAHDPPSTVCKVRIQIDVGGCHSRREQLRPRTERRAPEDESSLTVVIVRAGLRDCVEY